MGFVKINDEAFRLCAWVKTNRKGKYLALQAYETDEEGNPPTKAETI